MKNWVLTGLLATIGIGMLWAGGQQGAVVTAAPVNDEAGVRAAIDAYSASLRSGDLNAIMGHWAADADFTSDSGEVTRGRDAIGRLFVGSLEDLKAGKTTIKVETLRFLTPDVAAMDGTIEFAPANGPVEINRYSAVWAKKGGRWVIASARDLPEAEGQAADRGMKELQWLAGDWTAQKGDASIKLSVKPDLDGKFAMLRYEIKSPKETINVLQVLGWDPTEGALRSWTFDSRGGFGESAWIREGSVWMGDTIGVLPTGQVGSSLNFIEMKGPNSFVWKSTDREVEGQPIPDAEITYTRVAVAR
jgi:uncharacterized protein (TIGR02246 family)